MDEKPVKSVPPEELVSNKPSPPTKEVWKPDISKLPDAVVDGKFILKPGEDLVIQYPDLWRETTLWRVCLVYDDSAPTEIVEADVEEKTGIVRKRFLCVKGTTCRPGYVRLLDVQKMQYGATNYMEAKDHGLVLKVWTGKVPK